MSATADLTRRVSALEQAIAGLQGSEALQPNYLTVSPSGQVGANFSGKISASELDLIAGGSPSPVKWVTSGGAMVAELTGDAAGNLTLSGNSLSFASGTGVQLPAGIGGAGSPTPSSEIKWIHPTNGALISADIWASDTSAGNEEPALVLETSSLGDLAEIWIAANSGGSGTTFAPNNQALLQFLSANTAGNNQILAQATRGGVSRAAKIIDDVGNSGFVFNQVAGAGACAIAAGTGTLSYSGSNNTSTNITHGLGRTPKAVLGTLLAVGALSFSAILSATNIGSSGFTMGGFVTQGAITGNVGFSWLAIG